MIGSKNERYKKNEVSKLKPKKKPDVKKDLARKKKPKEKHDGLS